MKKLTLGKWIIDTETNTISVESSPVQLEPLTMKMLVFMTERQGQVVTRQVLMDHLWQDTVVSNDSLNRIASQLRKVFQDDEEIRIETIRSIGYRLSLGKTKKTFTGNSGKGNIGKLMIIGVMVLVLAMVIIFLTGKTAHDGPPKGPELEEYTQLPGFLLNPTMSPDDEVMAFSWNGGEGTTFNIYLKRPGSATPVKFSDGSFDLSPEWSPEGDFITYNSYDFMKSRSTLVIKSIVGDNVRTLNDIGGLNGSSPIDWAKDNSSIAIAAIPLGKRRSVIHLVDLKDLTRTPITTVTGDTTSHMIPRFSPDSQSILFLKMNAQVNDLSPTLHNRNDLILLDLQTMEQKLLIEDLNTPSGLEWIDEDNIMYINRENGRSQLMNYSLKDGKTTEVFSSANVAMKGFSLFNGQRKAIVEAQRSDFNIDKVILGDTAIASKTALINFTSSDLSPVLNSKGEMAFISDYSGIEQLWLLEKGERIPKQISYFKESLTLSHPSWSADDSHLIFSTKRTGYGIRIDKIRANGSGHEILVEGKANYDNPSWSKDGESIYFYSDSLKTPQLFKMNLETQEREQITFNEGLFGRETDRGFFFVKFNTAGIWKLNEQGTEERVVENLSFFGLSDWLVKGDTLVYLRTRNNAPALVFYDMKQKKNIREVALPDLKMPVPSLGVAMNLAENELYFTTSKELTSSLNTLEW